MGINAISPSVLSEEMGRLRKEIETAQIDDLGLSISQKIRELQRRSDLLGMIDQAIPLILHIEAAIADLVNGSAMSPAGDPEPPALPQIAGEVPVPETRGNAVRRLRFAQSQALADRQVEPEAWEYLMNHREGRAWMSRRGGAFVLLAGSIICKPGASWNHLSEPRKRAYHDITTGPNVAARDGVIFVLEDIPLDTPAMAASMACAGPQNAENWRTREFLSDVKGQVRKLSAAVARPAAVTPDTIEMDAAMSAVRRIHPGLSVNSDSRLFRILSKKGRRYVVIAPLRSMGKPGYSVFRIRADNLIRLHDMMPVRIYLILMHEGKLVQFPVNTLLPMVMRGEIPMNRGRYVQFRVTGTSQLNLCPDLRPEMELSHKIIGEYEHNAPDGTDAA